MSATSGTGEPTTMAGSAEAASPSGTASRTTPAPSAARARICASVASTSVVWVVVIDCTTTGAPSPTGTGPTWMRRVFRRSAIAEMLPWSYTPMRKARSSLT